VTWKSDVLPTIVQTGRRVDQGLHAGIVGRRIPLRRVMPKAQTLACFSGNSRHALKVLGVLLVGERVAAFDEVEAHLVQPLGDLQLVLQRKAHAFALGAVAEGGVVDLDGQLAAGERLLVSTGNLAAFSETVDYRIRGVGGCRKILFSGEGLFMAELVGPGRVLLQSLKRRSAKPHS
jgi:hypothetical protein